MQVPILPVNSFINYAKVLGVDAGVKYENNSLNQLPQHFADRFGWEELVLEISKEYHAIPIEDKSKTGILTNNWGIASAIHFYKDKYKLPEPSSNAGWFYFETMLNKTLVNKYICIGSGYSEAALSYYFNSVIKKRTFTHPYCMPHENNRPIFLCSDPKVDIAQYFKVERNIDADFLFILKEKGVNQAIEFYKKQKATNPKTMLFTENQINTLGYEYLGNHLIDKAILLFKFNVEEFPESFNVYDSLGEAYMEANEYELAVINYKKSIELNSDNSNGKKKLNELYKLMGERDNDKK